MSIKLKLNTAQTSNVHTEIQEDQHTTSSDESDQETTQINPKPPSITPPRKPINPKVFFANERTFLHWMQFCTIIGAVSVGLVNSGSQAGGMIFTFGAVFLMFYALVRFHERANRLQKRDQGNYGDKTGAYIAVGVIFGAVGLTLVKYARGEKHD